MRKATELIILIGITTIFTGLFLIAKTARADCYITGSLIELGGYRITDPISCTEKPSDVSGKDHVRLTECHCRGTTGFTINDVCSNEAERLLYDEGRVFNHYYLKGIPVNREKCPACLGEGTGYVDNCYDEPTEGVCNKAGWEFAGSFLFAIVNTYADSNAGLQCKWEIDEEVPSWSECTNIHERGSGYQSFTHLTYKPCNPPLTCEEKCQKEHQRKGKCLTGPESYITYLGDYPEPLNQGSTYGCDPDESCYCNNHKPVVENGYPILELDCNYRNHIDKNFTTFNEDIISEYDAEHLVCRANIYDQDLKDQEKLKYYHYRPDFEILYAQDINDNFQSLLRIQKQNIKCEANENNTVSCQASFPRSIIKEKIKRGMLLKCQVTPKDPYQQGEPKASDIKAIADHLYYFFDHQWPFGASVADSQYLKFLELSEVSASFKNKDRNEKIGKYYRYKGQVDVKMGKINLPSLREPTLNFSSVAKKLGAKWEKAKDDKISLVSQRLMDWCTEMIKESLGEGESTGGLVSKMRSDKIYFGVISRLGTFAHEMAHASIESALCDEYSKNFWTIQNEKESCPNLFPECCNEEGHCGTSDSCWGMPYPENKNEPKTDYNRYEDPPTKYLSIMSPYGPPNERIYPIEAQCPLRNCK